jgi:hypothetical protein
MHGHYGRWQVSVQNGSSVLRNSATINNDQSGTESFLYLGNMRGTIYGKLQPQQLRPFREAPDGEDRSTYLIDN